MSYEIRPMKWCTKEFPEYQVSSDGEVFHKGSKLKGYLRADGKHYIHLKLNSSIDKPLDLIVAYTFLNHYEKALMIEHIDGMKSNCKASNLKWITKESINQLYRDLGIFNEPWKFIMLNNHPNQKYIVKLNGEIFGFNNEIKSEFYNDKRGPVFHYKDLDGKLQRESVSRVVAQTYLPQIYGSNMVHHIDWNCYNNRVDNLVWCNFNSILKHSELY